MLTIILLSITKWMFLNLGHFCPVLNGAEQTLWNADWRHILVIVFARVVRRNNELLEYFEETAACCCNWRRICALVPRSTCRIRWCVVSRLFSPRARVGVQLINYFITLILQICVAYSSFWNNFSNIFFDLIVEIVLLNWITCLNSSYSLWTLPPLFGLPYFTPRYNLVDWFYPKSLISCSSLD